MAVLLVAVCMTQSDSSWLYSYMCNSSIFHSVLHSAQLKCLYHHLHPTTFLLSISALHLHPKNLLSPFYHPIYPIKSDILNVICAIIQVALVLCLVPFYTTFIFSLTFFDWIHTWMIPRKYETCGTEQNWEAVCSLQTTSVVCTRCLVQVMWFICVYF